MLIAAAYPAQILAQDANPTSAEALDKIASYVPDQDWYPVGYYDVRIAAESQIAETPRRVDDILVVCMDGKATQCYDIVDPDAEQTPAGETEPTLIRYGNIALEIARLRQDFLLIGFSDSEFAVPLAHYERQRLDAANAGTGADTIHGSFAQLNELAAAIETKRRGQTEQQPRLIVAGGVGDPKISSTGTGQATGEVIIVRSSGPSATKFPAGMRIKAGETILLETGDKIWLLTGDGSRTLQGPGSFSSAPTPRVAGASNPYTYSTRARTGAARRGRLRPSLPKPVIVQTSPLGGEILMVSAFAFKVCMRKPGDTWDRFGCKWNEIETGVGTRLSGRFVYQVKWPDGVIRKGTREIEPGMEKETVTVTFRKVGS